MKSFACNTASSNNRIKWFNAENRFASRNETADRNPYWRQRLTASDCVSGIGWHAHAAIHDDDDDGKVNSYRQYSRGEHHVSSRVDISTSQTNQSASCTSVRTMRSHVRTSEASRSCADRGIVRPTRTPPGQPLIRVIYYPFFCLVAVTSSAPLYYSISAAM